MVGCRVSACGLRVAWTACGPVWAKGARALEERMLLAPEKPLPRQEQALETRVLVPVKQNLVQVKRTLRHLRPQPPRATHREQSCRTSSCPAAGPHRGP